MLDYLLIIQNLLFIQIFISTHYDVNTVPGTAPDGKKNRAELTHRCGELGQLLNIAKNYA